MRSRLDPSRRAPPAQTTLRRPAILEGRGAHSNEPVRLTLSPAGVGTGVAFLRADAPAETEALVEAHWSRVSATRLRTRIGTGAASVSTIEHLMAAFAGLGVDNVLVEIDGPEVPAMDGSAHAFVAAIEEAGLKLLAAPRRVLRILEPVRVHEGAAFAEFSPSSSEGLRLDVEIDFPSALIGRQRLTLALTPGVSKRDLAPARSFGFIRDAERLWREGLALGACLENSVILDDERVLNPQGLRFPDEFVRHKMLDVLGDLALAGAAIEGAFKSYRGGHTLNLALVEKLMTTPGAFEWRETPGVRRARPSQVRAAIRA
jgi:UDP-3-O-[3-hydroxymyristoyl] N-acetylglucosamine deacetylase